MGPETKEIDNILNHLLGERTLEPTGAFADFYFNRKESLTFIRQGSGKDSKRTNTLKILNIYFKSYIKSKVLEKKKTFKTIIVFPYKYLESEKTIREILEYLDSIISQLGESDAKNFKPEIILAFPP